jgi:hypothetical protein
MPGKGPKGRSPFHSLIDRRRGAGATRAAVSRAALAVCAAVATAPGARAANVISTWKAGVTGNWNDATKWTNSPAAATFPNNGNLSNVYDAVIGSGTPVLNVPVTLHALTLNGGTIQTTAAFPAAGTNGITVTGGFRWSGGYFQVPVTVPSGATFTIDTTTGAAMGFGGTLTLGGTAAFAGTNAATIQGNRFDTRFNITSTGVLSLDRTLSVTLPSSANDPPQTRPYATLNNGGLITLGAGASLAGGAPVMLYSTGTVRATGASEISTSYAQSTGLIDLPSASSALTFRNAPAPDSTVLSGGIRLASGSALSVTRGGVVFAGPSVTNAGTINLQSDVRVSAPTTLPGVANWSGAAMMTLNADLTLTGRSIFYGGQVSGPGRLTAYDFKPQGATFVGGELYIPSTGSLDMGDSSSAGFGGGRLTLDGKAAWGRSGGGINAVGTSVARIDIRAGALVDIRPSATASFATRSGSTGPVADLLTNAGTIQVDRASLVVGQNWAFDNSGTVRVMPGGSATISSASATNSGTIDLQAGTSLLVNGNTYNSAANALGVKFRIDPTGVLRVGQNAAATLSPAGQLNNAGLVEVNGGRVTVDHTFFANSGAFTVNSGTATLGSFTLSNSGTIGAGASTLQITANAMTNTGRIDLGSGSTMTVSMPSGSSGTASFRNEAGGVLKIGPGSAAAFSPSNPNVFANAGAVEVDRGRLTMVDDWGLSNSGNIVVTSGVMRAALRSFTNTGGIDLRGGGRAVLASTSADAILNLQRVRDMVVSGYHAGAWDGVGIRSTSAAGDPTTAIGYGPAKASGTFLGVSVVASDVLVRHTKYGDATLDGVVNFDDLLALAKAYNATSAHWYQGDFSYDGVVNFDDLLILAKNYNAVMPTPGALPGATAAFSADVAAAFALAAVPEPSGVMILGAIGASMAAGRRRRRHLSPGRARLPV